MKQARLYSYHLSTNNRHNITDKVEYTAYYWQIMDTIAVGFFERLEARVAAVDSLLCVGLDPHVAEVVNVDSVVTGASIVSA